MTTLAAISLFIEACAALGIPRGVSSLVAFPGKVRAAECDGGVFNEQFDKCYYCTASPMNYGSASKCGGEPGARLVSIHSAFEQAFVFGTAQQKGINEDFFIGLSDFQCDGVWQWDDGKTSLFTNWQEGYPKQECGKGCAAVSIKNGKWFNTECTGQRPFVCDNAPYVGPNPSAKDGWIYSNITNAYYKVIQKVNGFDAEQQCISDGQREGASAHLVSIHSDDENELVKTLVNNEVGKSTSDCLTNFYLSQTWIGLRISSAALALSWTDGTAVTYKNWQTGQPDDDSGSEFCTELYVNCDCLSDPQDWSTYWNDFYCTDVMKTAVCKIPL